MSRFIKALFLWLTIIALPVQGYAASGMLLCGLKHGGQQHATSAQQAQKPMMMHHDCEQHSHHQSAAKPSMDAKHSHHAAKQHSEDGATFKYGKCSACAFSCCHAVALPNAPLQFATDIAHDSSFVYLAPEQLAKRIDRLERPPRSLLI